MFAAYVAEPSDDELRTSLCENKSLLPTATSFPPKNLSESVSTGRAAHVPENSDITPLKVSSSLKKEHLPDDDKSSKKHNEKKHSKKKRKKDRLESRSPSPELAVAKWKNGKTDRSVLAQEITVAVPAPSPYYFLDVKADKTNLYTCPYQNALLRYS